MFDPMKRWLHPLRDAENGGGGGTDTMTGAGADTLKGGQGGDTLAGGGDGKGTKTVLDDTLGGGGDGKGAGKPQTWPDDWRQKYAKDDAKKLERLARYASPEAALDALFAAEQRIRSGDLKKPAPGKDAKPEEVAAWRRENGIPDAPAGYLEKLPGGLVIGDADKPGMEKLAANLHALNARPEVAHAVISTYYELQEEQQAAQARKDTEARAATEDALRAEWGAEYRANLNAVKGFVDATIPADRRNAFLNARLGDGTALFNDDKIVRALLATAREANPMITVVPNNGGDAVQAVETELADLRKLMGDRSSAYWKGPEAERNQARYKELLEAKERAARRAA